MQRSAAGEGKARARNFGAKRVSTLGKRRVDNERRAYLPPITTTAVVSVRLRASSSLSRIPMLWSV